MGFRLMGTILMTLAGLFQTACVQLKTGEGGFDLDKRTIDSEWDRMTSEPRPLERPVVVLAGYRSPPMLAPSLKARLVRLTSHEHDDYLAVGYMLQSEFDNLVEFTVKRVDDRWPSEDPDQTIEVDVVAISMGGLVARYAAVPTDRRTAGGKRLNIRRLYTLASPHQGAKLADAIAPDRAARAMRPGSDFLAMLDSELELSGYELVCYAHLNDVWVGATRTAPPGQEPIWNGGTAIMSHFTASQDKRFHIDIARRLRGEEPLGEPSRPPRD